MAAIVSFTSEGMPGLIELINKMEEEGRPAAIQGTHNWLDFTADVADKLVPHGKTGNLARSQDVRLTENGGSIEYTMYYAAAVHWGYVQHWVKPKRRKALHWKGEGGEDRYSKGHKVPGKKARSKPNPWLFNAVDGSARYIKTFIIDEFNQRTGLGA